MHGVDLARRAGAEEPESPVRLWAKCKAVGNDDEDRNLQTRTGQVHATWHVDRCTGNRRVRRRGTQQPTQDRRQPVHPVRRARRGGHRHGPAGGVDH